MHLIRKIRIEYIHGGGYEWVVRVMLRSKRLSNSILTFSKGRIAGRIQSSLNICKIGICFFFVVSNWFSCCYGNFVGDKKAGKVSA